MAERFYTDEEVGLAPRRAPNLTAYSDAPEQPLSDAEVGLTPPVQTPSRGGYLTEVARGLTQFVPSTVKTASVLGENFLDRPALGVGPTGREVLRAVGVDTPANAVPEARPLYKLGERIEGALDETYPAVQEPERNLGHDVATGLGQMASMLAGGVVAKGLGATVKGAVALGTLLGSVQEFDDAFGRSRLRGDDPDTAFAKSLGYATVAGLIENKLGAGRILRKYFPDPALAAQKLSAWGISKDVAGSLAVGFGEEGSQRFAQNWIVEGKPSLEGVVQEGVPGGIVQAIAELPATLLRSQAAKRGARAAIARGPRREVEPVVEPEETNAANREQAPIQVPSRQPAESVPPASAGTSGQIQKPAAALPQGGRDAATEVAAQNPNLEQDLALLGDVMTELRGQIGVPTQADLIEVAKGPKPLTVIRDQLRRVLTEIDKRQGEFEGRIVDMPYRDLQGRLETRLNEIEREMAGKPPASVERQQKVAATPPSTLEAISDVIRNGNPELREGQIRTAAIASVIGDFKTPQDAYDASQAIIKAGRGTDTRPTAQGWPISYNEIARASELAGAKPVPTTAPVVFDSMFGPMPMFRATAEFSIPGLEGPAQSVGSKVTLAALEKAGLKVPEGELAKVTDLLPNKAAPAQSLMNGLTADSKSLADFVNTEAFTKQGLGGFDGITQRVMQEAVFRLIHDPQVFNAIVKLIPVDVMRVLGTGKLSPKMLFENMAVLANNHSVNRDVPITMLDAPSRAMALVASVAAKVHNVSREVPIVPDKADVAKRTSSSDLHGDTLGDKSAASTIKAYGGSAAALPRKTGAAAGETLTAPVVLEPPAAVSPVTGTPFTATVFRGVSDKTPNDKGIYSEGTHYTTSKDYASEYGPKRGGKIIEATVTLNNPFVATPTEMTKRHHNLSPREVRERLETEGHDGVVIIHPDNVAAAKAAGVTGRFLPARFGQEVIVFKPQQTPTENLRKQALAEVEREKGEGVEAVFAIGTNSHRDVQRMDRSGLPATGGLPAQLGSKTRVWKVPDTPKNRAAVAKLRLKERVKDTKRFNEQVAYIKRISQPKPPPDPEGGQPARPTEPKEPTKPSGGVATGIEGGTNEPNSQEPRREYEAGVEQKGKGDTSPGENAITERMGGGLQESGEVLWASRAEIEKLFSDANRTPALASEAGAPSRPDDGSGVGRVLRSVTAQRTPGVFEKTRVFAERPAESERVSVSERIGILANRILRGDNKSPTVEFNLRLISKLPGIKFVILDMGNGWGHAELQPNLDAIVINSSQLRTYDLSDPEAINTWDAILTEELLHAATRRLSSRAERESVWKSLTDDERSKVRDVYGGKELSDDGYGYEYLRLVLQDRLTGRATENYSGTWRVTGAVKERLKALLNFLREAFGAKPTNNIARQVIERIEAAIRGDAPIQRSIFEGGAGAIRTGIERDDNRHQVQGVRNLGSKYNPQAMAPLTAEIRAKYFDSTQPVTPENTSKAQELIDRMLDRVEGQKLLRELNPTGESDAAGQLLVNELADYARKLTIAGKPDMAWEIVHNWTDFQVVAGGLTVAGRAQRAVQESEAYSFYSETAKHLNRASEAGEKLVGRELFDALNNLTERTDVPPDVPVKVGKKVIKPTTPGAPTETVDDALENANARTALSILDRFEVKPTEWVKPDRVENPVVVIVREALKSPEPIYENPTPFIEAWSARLQEVEVPEEIADRLALEIHKERTTRWANARDQAIVRTSKRGTLSALVEEIRQTPYLLQRSPEWLRTTSENWFMSHGLSREQAVEAAKEFVPEFMEALTIAVEREATAVLKDKRLAQGTIDLIVRSIRSGLFDPAKSWYSDALAERGFKNITEADFKLLAELDRQYSNPDLSQPERSVVHDQIYATWRRLGAPPTVLSRMASNFVATLLTGFRTLGINIFGPNIQGIFEAGLTAISSPMDFPAMLKGALTGGRQWVDQVRFSLGRDGYSFVNNDFMASQNNLKAQWERGLRQIKSDKPLERTKGAANMIYGLQQFYMRLLNAVDNANAIVRRETQMALYTSQTMRALGKSTAEIRAAVDLGAMMREAYYSHAIDSGLEENVARVRASDLAHRDMVAWLENNVDAGLGERVKVAADMDAYSALGRLGDGITETDEGGLLSRTAMIPLLKTSNWMRQQEGIMPALAVSLFGYVNVPYRTARYYAWATPYGLLRMGIHSFRKHKGWENWWKQSLANELQERQRWKQAIAGSAVFAAVTGFGIAMLGTSADGGAGDDDDTGVYFTGEGPKNKQLRSAWLAKGFKPNSLVFFVAGKPISIEMSRSGEPFAHMTWLVAAHDQAAWVKKEAAAKGKVLEPSLSRDVAQAAGTFLGVMGQRGFLQTVTQIGEVASGRQDPRMFLAQKGSSVVSGAVTPFLGLQQSIAGMLSGAVDRSSIQSAIAANFPALEIFGDSVRKPVLNRFGDPLYNPETSWYHRMYYTGIPIAFSVADSPTNNALYGTLVEKGVAPPEIRRSTLEQKYGPLSDDKFQEFVTKSGPLLKGEVVRNIPTLKNMTPEGVKSFLDKSAETANRITAMGMGLESRTPSRARSAPAVSSLPAAPSTSRAIPASVGVSTGRARAAISRVPRTSRARSAIRLTSRRRLRTAVSRARRAIGTRFAKVRRSARGVIARIRRPRFGLSFA